MVWLTKRVSCQWELKKDDRLKHPAGNPQKENNSQTNEWLCNGIVQSFYIKVHETESIWQSWSALKTSMSWVSRNYVAESRNCVKFLH